MEYQLQRENPIAVFDSGVGGISVLRELIRIMPEEDFIYFGDSKNAPYGTKEKEKVRELTIGCARKLFDQGQKVLWLPAIQPPVLLSGNCARCIRIFRLSGLNRH